MWTWLMVIGLFTCTAASQTTDWKEWVDSRRSLAAGLSTSSTANCNCWPGDICPMSPTTYCCYGQTPCPIRGSAQNCKCSDLNEDGNCGTCGTTCGAGSKCSGHACVAAQLADLAANVNVAAQPPPNLAAAQGLSCPSEGCRCRLPTGFDINQDDLAGAIKAFGLDCPADPSPDCRIGNYGFNNEGGCGNVGCNNHGSNNIGNNNTGIGNKGDYNVGTNNVGWCLHGTNLAGNHCAAKAVGLPCPSGCRCRLPAGFDINQDDLSGAIKAFGLDCPADPSPDCRIGNYGFNNEGGCGNVGCNNKGTGNIGNNNTGTGNNGDYNTGTNNIGWCLDGTNLYGNNC